MRRARPGAIGAAALCAALAGCAGGKPDAVPPPAATLVDQSRPAAIGPAKLEPPMPPPNGAGPGFAVEAASLKLSFDMHELLVVCGG